uniref:Uncharacterized protein n=1 Tax=Oryza brachyantha TaxID=4533 RepID=J3LB87_ORYBR
MWKLKSNQFQMDRLGCNHKHTLSTISTILKGAGIWPSSEFWPGVATRRCRRVTHVGARANFTILHKSTYVFSYFVIGPSRNFFWFCALVFRPPTSYNILCEEEKIRKI